MVKTEEKCLYLDERIYDPLPLTSEENIITNFFRIRILENFELEPGTTSYDQYQRLTELMDMFLENYPAKSGEVIIDFHLPGLLRLTITKP